jgi:predicted alpha-1,6-mannanase (GH76 family)
MRLAVLAVVAACGAPPAQIAADGNAEVDAVTSDATAGSADNGAAMWHAHADAALETLLLRYWTPSAAYLGAVAPADGSITQYWTFAQALDAVIDGAERTGGARFGGWSEALYLAQDAKGWSRDYYDDENWMALALLRAGDDPKYLSRAESLYADIMAAWDTTCCGAHPGGLWWDRPHTQKATAANAGPVITGVRLAARTGDASYLAFAKQVYAYWRANMVDPSTFAVFDHVTTSGIVKYKFTYNEGLMIGAAVALHEATGDAAYLDDAEHIAGYMLANEVTSGVLFDGTNTNCNGDCQQFKGIGFRYLQTLAAADPHPEYTHVLAASANAIWDHARASNGLFAADWNGPATATSSIDADSSATMALAIYAQSLGPYPATTSRYEAEDGVVHGLGIEATHAGFTGWAYLAGWNAPGQWVDFHATVATAGTYHLTLRYAAGAGDAARLIYINGANAIAAQPFATTTTWDTWASTTAIVTLPAGASTISVIYNTGLGSKNYLNLDWIDLQ